MTEPNRAYAAEFTKLYAVVAAGVFLIFLAVSAFYPQAMANAIMRGALIGGSIGAIMWPVMAFANAFLETEGRKAEGTEAWRYAIRFALRALLVNLVLSGAWLLYVYASGGLRGGDLGIGIGLVAVLVGLLFLLQIPMFRMFTWSAFKGAEKRAAQARNG